MKGFIRKKELKDRQENIEREFYKMYKVLEYKLYEFNNNTNTLLYLLELNMNKKESPSETPLVSVVIPVYNGSNYLSQAIDSALAQTYKNTEIIVVNDGSNDDGKTEKIALSYGNKIRYFKKENGGVSSALNYGIKNMKGKYFTWLSHDDIYYPNHIETHMDYILNSKDKKIMTFTNFNIVDENLNILMEDNVICGLHCFDYKMTKLKPEYALLQGEINGGSVVISKSILDEVGLFNENLRISQEREMWSRIMKKNRLVNIPIVTNLIRTHKKQVTKVNNNVVIETNNTRKRIIDELASETMKRLEGSVMNFYLVMRKFYYNNNLLEMVDYIDKKIEALNEKSNN